MVVHCAVRLSLGAHLRRGATCQRRNRESGGEQAVITGDMMHHPVQFAEPVWYSTADGDIEISTQTRRKFLDTYTDQPVTIIGTHFAGPTSGRIVRQPEGTRFITD